jgi:general secretion pathway protein D
MTADVPSKPFARRSIDALRGGAIALALLALLGGCAEQRIRDQSQTELNAGDYEKALAQLGEGLKQYPDSTLLRAGQLNARAVAVARIVSNAQALQAAGKPAEALRELQRAQTLDPQNRRLDALVQELDTERRQQAALASAEQWVAKKRPEMALSVIEQALKDNPRHAGLQTLQRRLELDQRDQQVRAAQTPLAETRPISLDFRDTSLRTVLDVVSRNSGINFILDKDIRADTRVTVFLRQARLEDALDLIVSTNQLAKKVVDSQTIVVYPNTPDKQREYQEQIVRVFYLASTEAKGAASFLKAMLKIREPFVDERTNMLALRESQENIQLAERLIALYDSADPEVMLEVEVLEINSTRLTELGVKFPDAISLTVLPPAGADGLTLANIRGLTRDRIGLGVGGLLINLKREVGDFTTLANPKIRARNKEKAKVLIGDKIPIVTSTTGTGGFVSDSVSYLDVGLKLDVEPTVYNDDDVAIKIALEVSTLGTAVKTASGTLAYQIGTRNASTVLRLHDGETQLLAGLISKDDRTNSSRVPGVGDLPVLGRLFSSQVDNSQRTELVLAITPRVLRNVRRPDANETELWVGTEAQPRLRPVGGLRALAAPVADNVSAPARGAPGPALMAPEPSLVAPVPTPAAIEPVIAFKWSGPAKARVGDTLELKLELTAKMPLRGTPMEIAFPKDKLQLIDVAEGEFFRRDGAATSFSKGGDGKEGRVGVGVLRNQGNGLSGVGSVLTLKFKAISAGPAEVKLMSAQGIGLEGPLPPPALGLPFAVQIR